MNIAHLLWLRAVAALAFSPIAALAAPTAIAPIVKISDRPPTELLGVTVGGASTAIATKCKSGWKCVTKKRTVRGVALEQTVATLATGDFARVAFVSKGGKVLSAKGTYRAKDKQRAATLSRTYGTGSKNSKGSIGWLAADRKVTAELTRDGAALKIFALDEAKKSGAITEIIAQNYQLKFPILSPHVAVAASSYAISLTTQALVVAQNGLLEKTVEVRNRSRVRTAAGELRSILTRVGANAPVTTRTYPVPALDAGATHRIFVPIYNTPQPAGNYEAEVSIGGAAESRAVLVTPLAPDLVIAQGEVPATAVPSSNINVRVKVTNAGTIDARQNFKVRFWITGQETIEVPVSAPLLRNASVWVPARLKFEPTHDGDVLTVKARVVSDETYLRHNATRWTVRANVPDVDFAPSEKITATIHLKAIHCDDEEEGDFWGDDEPSLYYAGFHTASPHTWNGGPLHTDDFDVGEKRGIDQGIFPEGDRKRTVKTNERIGFFVSLWDGPWEDEDSLEWDYFTRTYPFKWLRDHAGQTVTGTGRFEADDDALEVGHATYRVTYEVRVGQVQPVPAPEQDPSVFANVTAPTWAGRYAVTLDGANATAELRFAQPTANYPQGKFTGTWTEGGVNKDIESIRLIGNYWQFKVGSKTFVAYLMGDMQRPSIAGTMTSSGRESGFLMTKNL